MAPIYDTDIAEERWSRAEWSRYELWEKVEVRLRRRKRLWILATSLAVFALFSVPIVTDQRAKWDSLATARVLATEINWIKREASIQNQAFRLVFPASNRYRVEKVTSCSSGTLDAVPVREAALAPPPQALSILGSEKSPEIGISGLVTEFCYDPLLGSEATANSTAGIGIIPSADINSARTDRLSVLLVSGPSADISFD